MLIQTLFKKNTKIVQLKMFYSNYVVEIESYTKQKIMPF